MKHYYENVPGLGNVAVSRHAQSQMLEVGIRKRRSTARCVTNMPAAVSFTSTFSLNNALPFSLAGC